MMKTIVNINLNNNKDNTHFQIIKYVFGLLLKNMTS